MHSTARAHSAATLLPPPAECGRGRLGGLRRMCWHKPRQCNARHRQRLRSRPQRIGLLLGQCARGRLAVQRSCRFARQRCPLNLFRRCWQPRGSTNVGGWRHPSVSGMHLRPRVHHRHPSVVPRAMLPAPRRLACGGPWPATARCLRPAPPRSLKSLRPHLPWLLGHSQPPRVATFPSWIEGGSLPPLAVSHPQLHGA